MAGETSKIGYILKIEPTIDVLGALGVKKKKFRDDFKIICKEKRTCLVYNKAASNPVALLLTWLYLFLFVCCLF